MAVQREQVVQTAEKYVSRGKIEPAIREYRKLLADNPNDINTLNRIGDLYARIQRIDEAVDFFTQIAEQYSTEGFFVKAIAIYKKIIKLDPTRLEVYEKLAELYHRQGLVNEARTQYQVLADYYQKHDNAASAIAIYQKMADLEPSNPSYHVKLAEIYQSQQLIEKAMNEYRVIAEMMIAHGRPQDAAQVYERALDIDSSNMGFINDAVFKLKEAGHAAAAVRFLGIAAERNPQATRIGRLARVIEEPEVVEPAPPAPRAQEPAEAPRRSSAAPPPPPAARAPEPRPAPPPPPPAVEEEPEDVPYGSGLLEQSWADADDLSASLRAAAAAAIPSLEPPGAELEEQEIELDLDEAFVLDMDADDEPASLVKPPADMLSGTGSRLGSAWARGEEPAAPPQAPVPPPLPAAGAPSALLSLDADLELDLDLGELAAAPSPVPPPGAFDPAGLPSDGEILLELEEPELPRFESSWAVERELDLPPLESLEAGPAKRDGIDADMLERTAAELQPRTHPRDEDLVSEAEVLAKYGLEDKALERLREALKLQPHNLGAYAAMIHIHLDKGRHDRVAELAGAMARTAGEVRDDAQVWPKMRRQLGEAGYRFDGDRVAGGPHAMQAMTEAPPAAPPPAPVAKAPEPPPAPQPIPLAPVAQAPAPEPAPVPEALSPPAPPAAARKRSSGEIDRVLRSLLAPKPKRPAAAPPPPAAAPPAPPVAAAPAAPVLPPAEPAPPVAGEAVGPVMFNPLEIGEMIESEDFDWTPPAATAAVPAFPSSARPPAPAGGRGLPQGLPQNLDDTGGLSWLDEADRNRPAKQAESESLFDEEDDFFDLAAELEQELSQEDLFQSGEGMLSQPGEQSLEEIVEGFKKGVAEHLSPTDYDTHFNLGIAYREMGLLDEAIGEFQIAAKDEGHLVLCCSMLGLCFLDKGLPELAVKWYGRGLDAPGLHEEDHLGLLYDLGCAYLVVGDKTSAYKAFVDLYGINNSYRDVVARIEELGR
ncbi:MAG TPA: tetratricopeptide repeat protein [Thermoanaerobaculia bacterium]|jgi:tetratricopeptide (TPR) repeat protein